MKLKSQDKINNLIAESEAIKLKRDKKINEELEKIRDRMAEDEIKIEKAREELNAEIIIDLENEMQGLKKLEGQFQKELYKPIIKEEEAMEMMQTLQEELTSLEDEKQTIIEEYIKKANALNFELQDTVEEVGLTLKKIYSLAEHDHISDMSFFTAFELMKISNVKEIANSIYSNSFTLDY